VRRRGRLGRPRHGRRPRPCCHAAPRRTLGFCRLPHGRRSGRRPHGRKSSPHSPGRPWSRRSCRGRWYPRTCFRRGTVSWPPTPPRSPEARSRPL
ncbi:hypothetical protein AVDCRST_MAG82-861, partial [uncultured Rubrobacteraceae bacterium]